MIHFFPSQAVFLSIGPVSVHWYGIMYLLGFLIGTVLLPRLMRFRGLTLTPADQESLLLHVFFGVLLGGRIGFILLYGGTYYLHAPLEIFAVWNGGMASHGGFIGVFLALVLFCKKKNISLFALADVIVVPVAIGLALGRIGNLINGELYGTITTVPWAMSFPGALGLRHPTQIYACLKDLFIACICFAHLRKTASASLYRYSGMTSAIFLTMYGILRFIVELYRDQPYGFTQLGVVSLSRGQLFTLPIIAGGLLLGIFVWKKGAKD